MGRRFGRDLVCVLMLARATAALATGNDALPLLGSSHGGHAWDAFCAGQPSDAPLPPDPRSLVQPGVNAAKAVYFSAWFKNCHVNAGPADAAPVTCGEYRARIARGAILLEGNGGIGAGSLINGD